MHRTKSIENSNNKDYDGSVTHNSSWDNTKSNNKHHIKWNNKYHIKCNNNGFGACSVIS